MYDHLLKPILFRFDPEKVHDFFIYLGEYLGSSPWSRAVTENIYGYSGPEISKTVDGIIFRTPFVLAAGFDYNGRLPGILPHIGLGGEEVGSVTARPCAGNPKPRLKRLPLSQSILVNKGLRNDGVDRVIERLREWKDDDGKWGKGFVVGVSIARTNDEQSVPIEAGIEDYCYSFKRLNEESVGDYYTLNISCPNAFGAEAFTEPALLDGLLSAIRKIPCSKPIYVKMPINVPWNQFSELLKVIDKHGLNGVVIGNLNKDYSSLDFPSEAPTTYEGGLSGKPCQDLSNELIRKTKGAYGDRFTLIGAGGVMSSDDAMEKFAAGADLVQLITGVIYKGPGLVKKMSAAFAQTSLNATI